MIAVRRTALTGLPFLILAALLVAGTVPALGKRFVATKRADRVVGTKRADSIRAGAGNDRVSGKAGNDRISGGTGNDRLNGDSGRDRISGGRGKDRLSGGRGKDRLAGGPGNDVLNAVDRSKDSRIDGGAGRNTCKVDAADLRVVRHCARLVVSGRGSSGGGSGGSGGSGGGGVGAAALGLSTADGLSCGSQLPLCTFQLSGRGADAAAGTVTGGDGVTGGGGSVSTSGDSWSATGTYGCTSNGYLLVTIGEESLKVPVSCTT
jgi:Ca2+-binding RTX toxin-like protein